MVRSVARAALVPLPLLLVVACGTPPPVAPTAPAPLPVATKEKQPDISPVPEPPGLIVLGRVAKPDALIAAAISWAKLPMPVGKELLRSITEDEALPDVVDLSQPFDVAITQSGRGRKHSPLDLDPLAAFSVAVTSFDAAKSRLGAVHRLIPGSNGDYRVLGVGAASHPPRVPSNGERADQEEDDDDGLTCLLGHAPVGARLVCGEPQALDVLAPYLTRTLPREKWASDVHIELRPEPLRKIAEDFRQQIPFIGQALLGSSSGSLGALADAAISEAFDFAGDAQKLSLDANVADSGLTLATRLEFRTQKSTFAKMLTTGDRADAPPPAFWHLPAETDLALFGRGSDPRLFDHARELLANVLVEAADAGGMPESEKRAVKDLVADRMLALFTSGPGLYAKGYDAAALDKAVRARRDVKESDVPATSEAKRILVEQALGWHLYQVNEPVAKVGPILKDWSTLWNRPAFAKWAQSKTEAGTLPKMRLAPAPAGVTLPKEAVHLEISIPRDDVDLDVSPAPPIHPSGPATGGRGKPSAPIAVAPKKPRKFHRTPVILHVFAIPDEGATWIALGMDGKLTAEKALASRSSAPDKNTLGSAPSGREALREGKMTAGGFGTLRGLVALTAMSAYEDRSPWALLSTLPAKGATPVLFTGHPEPKSQSAAAGASTGELRIPRAVIEDVVKLIMAAR